jgi:DNA polymerase-3 subunit gamma/tau
MSYLVLARKYRPKTFVEMVGQDHVVQALTNALSSQRLHHAYLFTGTRGVGKTTVSRILAKSLNCEQGITATPCGQCAACLDIDAGRFVDYTELDAASHRGVDEVQQLLEQAVYKPVQGRFKVFMIDEVHMLSNTAFNAMLKTLEEPPEYLKFVLATTDPQKVPVTVLSRCLQFNLRPMAPETVLSHLTTVLQAEHIPADTQSLRWIARAARGSMRDALSLTDQAIAYGAGQLQEDTVRQMLGTADRSRVMSLIEALAQGNGAQVVAQCDALRDAGLNAASTLEDMAWVLQRMAVLQLAGGEPESAQDPDPEAVRLAELAAIMPADETQLLYSLCLQGRQELGLAPDEYAGLTMVLLRLLAFQSPPSGSGAEKKNSELSRTAVTPSAPPVVAQPLVPAAASHPVPSRVTAPADAPTIAASAGTPPGQRLPVRGMLTESRGGPDESGEIPRSGSPAASGHRAGNGAAREGDGTASGAASGAERGPATRSSTGLTSAPPSGSSGVPTHGRATPPWEDEPTGPLVAVPVRHSPTLDADAPPRPTSAVEAVPSTPEGDVWQDLVQSMVAAEQIQALTRELALQSQLVARDSDTWLLRIERESLNGANSRERLERALAQAGHAVTLQVEIGRVTDSPAKRQTALAALRQREAESIILDDPTVQQLMHDFGATIVPGSIRPL